MTNKKEKQWNSLPLETCDLKIKIFGEGYRIQAKKELIGFGKDNPNRFQLNEAANIWIIF